MGWKRFGSMLVACGLVLGMAACAEPTQGTAAVSQTPNPSKTFGLQRTSEPTTEPGLPTKRAEVTKIVDGDTIDVRLADGSTERVRFIGMDTPERGRTLASKATAYTAGEASVGSAVYLELDVDHRDRYGRLLAYVWLSKPRTGSRSEAGDNMLNARLVRQGLAVLLTIQPNSNYADLFKTMQSRARDEELNLWKPAAPGKPKAPPTNCHPSYRGKCLKPDSSDYDCAGGSGDGPDYVDGPVYVDGDDPYDLDSDGDGVACA